MELDTLTLTNFRQFYEQQTVNFSQDDDQNVTVIHGSNGSGKTTILNGFLWLFYDEVNLPRPGQIPNERALAESGASGTVKVEVSLTFDHEGMAYTATRTKHYKREDTGFSSSIIDESLTVEFIDQDGNHKRRGNPEDTLSNIMPERLREIFFFDGETIDQLSALGGQEKIQTAIQNIMGLTILERADRHLKKAQKRFEEEASKHGSDKLSQLYDQLNELEDERSSLESTLDDVQASKTEAEKERSKVIKRLGELEGSRGLQDERESLEEDVEGLEDDIDEIESEIAERISDDGYVTFAMPALETTAEMLREKRQQGEIPTEIKSQFVEDLLEIEECICGRELAPETEPYQQVASWRERGGSTELEEAAMTIAGRLTEIGTGEEALYEDIEELLARRSSKEDIRTQKEERISEISNLLSDVDTENISELESRRAALDEDIGGYDREIGRIDNQIEDLTEEIETLEEEIETAEEQDDLADLARRRAQLARHLRSRVSDLFDQYQDTVRRSVNDRVNDIFRGIIAKGYYAEIAEDYSLKILKDVGTEEAIPVAKSTGERQVASLAFISSLVSLAKERHESDEEAAYFKGGIYPMIMDSPFGSLDPQYQERISSMLPKMAQQVVVLVTDAQWSEEVQGEMGEVSGAEYSLEYYDPEEDDVKYEWTEIVRTGGAA